MPSAGESAGGAAPASLDDFYLETLREIEAQDPEFAELVRSDPELQAQIYADAKAALGIN